MPRILLSLASGTLLAFALALEPAAAQIAPADPQPATSELAPGLAVRYHRTLVRHIDELVDYMEGREGEAGPPIPRLDYRVGQGKVLTSDGTDGIGAKITGFIRLDAPGTYSFSVRSNDGVRIALGREEIIEDPDVHADRFSNIVKLEVREPGWYPLEILYFERKNTSTLELYWKRPGEEDGSLALVPAEAFAHQKSPGS